MFIFTYVNEHISLSSCDSLIRGLTSPRFEGVTGFDKVIIGYMLSGCRHLSLRLRIVNIYAGLFKL